MIPSRRLALRAGVLLAVAFVLLGSLGAGQALAAGPRLSIVTRPAPSLLAPGKGGEMLTVVTNLGGESVVATEKNPIVFTDNLPPGLRAVTPMRGSPQGGAKLEPPVSPPLLKCQPLPAVSCTFTGTVQPYGSIELAVGAVASESFAGESNEVQASGGNIGATSATGFVRGQRERGPLRCRTFRTAARRRKRGARRARRIAPVRAHDEPRAEPDLQGIAPLQPGAAAQRVHDAAARADRRHRWRCRSAPPRTSQRSAKGPSTCVPRTPPSVSRS